MDLVCPRCRNGIHNSDLSEKIVRNGFFIRGRHLEAKYQTRHQRYLCRRCKCSFYEGTLKPKYRFKRRDIDKLLFKFLASGVSIRRLALNFEANRKTIERRFLFYGEQAQTYMRMESCPSNRRLSEIYFDDMETFIHTKLKPVSVPIFVVPGSRKIVGIEVAKMPANGLLAKRSLVKYGFRDDERMKKREALFNKMTKLLDDRVVISTDMNPHYSGTIKKVFPLSEHRVYKGKRERYAGLGELKVGGFDPLFSLNHTFAMFRYGVSRLIKKTWCTSKTENGLKLHLTIYAHYHNTQLIMKKRSKKTK